MKGSLAQRNAVATVTLDMSGTNVTTAAYATLQAKTANIKASSALEIFNPSGSPMKLALGDAGSEADMPYTIMPGGTATFLAMEIPSGVRISLKAIDTSVTSGRFILNRFA